MIAADGCASRRGRTFR